MAADQLHVEDAAVRHLVELGYVDPQETAARETKRRQQLDASLQDALESANQGRMSEAIDRLNRLIADDSDWLGPRQLLADLHFRSGDRAEIRRQLDWLAQHNVITPRLAFIAGSLAVERRDLQAALIDLEYAAHADRTIAGVHALLGSVQMRLGNWDAAEDSLHHAVRQNRADARSLDALAAIALHRRDFEDAAHWSLKALEADIRLSLAHFHLGIALAHLDRHDAAAEAFVTCARLDPSRAAPLYLLSRLAGRTGDTSRAGEYRQKARDVIRQRRAAK